MNEQQMVIFNGKDIRRIMYRQEWFFPIIDIVGVLSESPIALIYRALIFYTSYFLKLRLIH